jgi:hypothetical protein
VTDPDRAGGTKRKWPRWSSPDDDMVEGFDRAGRPQGLRAFFATTIAGSLFAWDIAFTLGAYHTVFYSRLFQILVVSSVLLLGSLVLRRTVKVRLWSRLLLSIPLVWLVVRLAAPFGRLSGSEHVLDLVLVGLTVASVPFTMWALVRVMSPEYFALPARRLKIAAVSIVVLIALTGYLVGQFNYRFTNCQQYVVAGNDEPTNCQPAPSHSPSSPAPSP